MKLKDVCNINMGQSPDSDSYNDNEDGIPFFQGNADFGEKYPTTRKWCNAPTKIAHAEDILISVRAPIGALNYAKEECCIGRGLAAITPNQDKVSSGFIYWLLKGKHKELNLQGTGSTFKAISRKVLEEIKVPDIELKKQTELAGSLEKVYSVIQLRKQQLEELDILIKARFVEMFGDPVSNPFNYDKVRLSQIADIKIGPFGSLLHKEDYIENGHPLVNPSHIVDSKISVDNKLTISNEKYEELGAYKLQIGDVVMGRRGEMGRCAVVLEDGLLCGTGSILIRPTQNVTADFIQKIISFPSFKKTIEDMAVGQTMPNLNVPIVSNFEIIHPPVEVQKSYYDFVTQVDKLKLIFHIF
ncbi:MAG: restriction endonuclease subunit S [Roseburia faecis]